MGLNKFESSLFRLLSMSIILRRFWSSKIFPFKLILSPGERSEIMLNEDTVYMDMWIKLTVAFPSVTIYSSL